MLKDITILILSLLIIAAFFADAYFVLADRVTTTDANILLLVGNVSGGVQTLAGSVIAYWFGTSKSSSDKDKQIADMQNNPQPKTGA